MSIPLHFAVNFLYGSTTTSTTFKVDRKIQNKPGGKFSLKTPISADSVFSMIRSCDVTASDLVAAVAKGLAGQVGGQTVEDQISTG